jgi:hypothetical protein
MPALSSSCLSWVDYDSGTIQFRFRNGRSYTLRGVPEHHYYGLTNATSPGWHFNTYLKNRY